jgi:hypothetical protein
LTNALGCGIIYTERKREVINMEKVIRICEITGRMTVVAENLFPHDARELVFESARNDPYGCYYRIKM